MVKLIACDIDGTLLGKDEKVIGRDVAEALEKQARSGKTIALASGRSYYSMKKIASSLSFAEDIYYICNDGAICVYKGKVLYHKQISIENLLRFSRNPEYSSLPVMYYSSDFSYVTGTTPEFLDMLEENNIDALDPISGIYDVKAPIFKVGVYGFDKMPEKLAPCPFELRVCYNSYNWLEYTSRFANKGLALSDLQMRLYVSKLDTAAFGDGDNDIEMFSKAKYTFAKRSGNKALCENAREHFDDVASAIDSIL